MSKYDIACFSGPNDLTVKKSEIMSIFNNGRYVEGTEKLFQTITIKLLTPRGSVLSDPDDGTELLNNLWLGKINRTNMRQHLSVALNDVLNYLRTNQQESDGPNEIVSRLDIKTIEIIDGTLIFNVTVVTNGGSSDLQIPVAMSENRN